MQQLKNVKIISDTTIDCCTIDNSRAVTGEANSRSPQVQADNVYQYQQEIVFLKAIIQEKNTIINQQNDVIYSLKEQVKLIKENELLKANGNSSAQIMQPGYANAVKQTNTTNVGGSGTSRNTSGSQINPQGSAGNRVVQTGRLKNGGDNAEKIQSIPRKRVVKLGTNESVEDNFSGRDNPKKRAWFFISRVNDEVNEDIVANYIARKTQVSKDDVVVSQIEVNYEKKDNKCFKVGVDFEHKDLMYSNEFWPKGVLYRRFRFVYDKNKPNVEPKNQNTFL